MDFTAEVVGKTLVLSLSGDLKSAGLDATARRITGAIGGSESGRVLLNLDAVKTIDSAGIGFLVSLYKETVAKEGSLGLCGGAKAVRKVMEEAELNRLIKVFDSQTEALGKF